MAAAVLHAVSSLAALEEFVAEFVADYVAGDVKVVVAEGDCS